MIVCLMGPPNKAGQYVDNEAVIETGLNKDVY